jgi:AraC-like DNA-binding protein
MIAGLRIRTDTSDPTEARIQLTPTYPAHRLTIDGEVSAFRARHAEGGTSDLGVYYLSYGPSTTTVDPLKFCDFVQISQPIRGRLGVRAASGERILSAGDHLVMDAHTFYQLRWEDNCAVFNVRLPRAEFEMAIAELSGMDEPGPVRIPVSRRPSRQGRTAVDKVTRFLLRDAVPTGLLTSAPLLRAQMRRMLVASILEAYPGVFHSADAVSSSDVKPPAVRRAIAYIEDAVAEDIRISDVAAAARLSTRALQEAFRKHLDTTPMAYLKSIRLARAHADLRQSSVEEGMTVAAVAYRWGFGNLGRFAADYRRKFGRSPSDVLRAPR